MISLPALYPITDDASEVSPADQITRLGAMGFPLVQFRCKTLDARAQFEALCSALRASRENGGWPQICVNDRADLALLAVEAGLSPWGLHLGQDDLPHDEAKRLLGLGSLHFGASTHEAKEWNALSACVDHAGIGPFRSTQSKGDHAKPLGLEGFAQGAVILRSKDVASIAIGGLSAEDAESCFLAGAESLAMIGEVSRSRDPAELGWKIQAARCVARPLSRTQGIVLLGSSGAGKSTLGPLLAQGLGFPFHDLDKWIETRTHQSIPQIFETQGEAAFRALEAELLPSLLAAPAVVALGGGAFESDAVREAVTRSGFRVFWLAETPRRCWERIRQDPQRPLAQDSITFFARHRARLQRWMEAPILMPMGRDPETMAQLLLNTLR
jgi:thiamine-phosphate diphosphorylase